MKKIYVALDDDLHRRFKQRMEQEYRQMSRYTARLIRLDMQAYEAGLKKMEERTRKKGDSK